MTAYTQQIEVILSALEMQYGKPAFYPSGDPFAELIRTILSQNTSDMNSRPAFTALSTRFKSWDYLIKIDTAELAMIIKQSGLGKVKARRIQQALSAILQKRNNLSLDFLSDMPSDEAREWLKDLPGVGEKTASCVLLFAFGKPVLPVDTHVYRLSKRLELLDSTVRPEQASKLLESIIPSEKVYEFHVLLITHGRKICKARRPLCQACVLRSLCPSVSFFTIISG